jgi:hypothetical protein
LNPSNGLRRHFEFKRLDDNVAAFKSMETSAFLKKPPRRLGGAILFAFWEHQESNTPQWRLESVEQRKEREFLEGAGAWAG